MIDANFQDISESHNSLLPEDGSKKIKSENEVIIATIRLLCAWMAEETSALREEVYDILPFVMSVAVETYEGQREEKLAELPNANKGDVAEQGKAKVDILFKRVYLSKWFREFRELCHQLLLAPRKLSKKNLTAKYIFKSLKFDFS